MTNKIIDIDNNQLEKLTFEETIGESKVHEKTIKQRLKASMVRPMQRRQSLKIIFETKRGFFRVHTKLLSLGNRHTTIKGGHTIPLESIVKVN